MKYVALENLTFRHSLDMQKLESKMHGDALDSRQMITGPS